MFNIMCTVAASLLTVSGLVGNIMIIMAFFKTQTLRTSANCYIVNMAISDLIFIVLVGPWIIIECFTGFKTFTFDFMDSAGTFLCQTIGFVALISSTVSITSNLLITKDRFIASVYPLKMNMITTKIRTILLSLTWLFAIAVNLPYCFYFSLFHVGGQAFCSIKDNTFMFIYSFVDFILWYCVPFILIIVLYYNIIKSLRRPRPGDGVRRNRQNRKVIKIVISIVAACFICWTPYHIYAFLQIANAEFLFKDKCFILGTLSYYLFPLLNTVINPVILFLFGTNYRAALSSWRLCQWKCSRGRVAPQNEIELELPRTTGSGWPTQI